MMKSFALFFWLSMMAIPLKAMDLASALSAGKVCELPTGYIQATPGYETEMAGLVANVNGRRARIYSDIAQQDGADPATVGVTQAQQEKAAHPERFCR